MYAQELVDRAMDILAETGTAHLTCPCWVTADYSAKLRCIAREEGVRMRIDRKAIDGIWDRLYIYLRKGN